MNSITSLGINLSIFYSADKKESPISLDMACHKILSIVVCSFQYSNVASEDYYILKHGTPFEGLLSPFIAIYHRDHTVKYEGPYVYNVPPNKDDFVLIERGASISTTAQVSDVYSFNSNGLYIIQYSNPLRVISKANLDLQSDAGKIREIEQIRVNKVIHITLNNTRSNLPPRQVRKQSTNTVNIAHCGRIRFIGGSEKDRNETLKAHKRLCKGYKIILRKISDEADDIFKTWFSSAFTHLMKVTYTYEECFHKIYDMIVTYDFTGTKCNERVYAYTYKNTTTIYLCEQYNEDPINCMPHHGSKEGKLVNLMTIAFGLAQNYAYDANECAELVHTTPFKCISNAKSYELFYCQSRGKAKSIQSIIIPESFM